MACPGLDPRGGTTCAQCLGKKMTSYVIGYLQTIFWMGALISLAISPQYMQTGQIVLAVLLGIVILAFSVLLLLGLHQDRRLYIKAYLIFCAVFTIILIIGVIATLFTSPSKLGFKGFVIDFIVILLNVVTIIAVRSYYITTYS